MSLSLSKRQEVMNRLLREIKKGTLVPADISQHLGVSRQTVYKYLSNLVNSGQVILKKQKRHNSYFIKKEETYFNYPILGLEEDVVWRENILPLLRNLPKNVLQACNYGFTEILNNAIDHSGATSVNVCVTQDATSVEFAIGDKGVGIFNKIQRALNLEYPYYAILELAKGKLTTDPNRHSGEGIFFTSRIFNVFYIRSNGLNFLSGRNDGTDYLLEGHKNENGTWVTMNIEKDSNIITKDIFDQYTAKDDDYGFSKTHIPVRLVDHEGVSLVSRSQAKRLLRRFDRFMEIVLDFKDVKEIGQGFADEIFRVFKIDHPNVELLPINMTDDVKKMVFRAILATNTK